MKELIELKQNNKDNAKSLWWYSWKRLKRNKLAIVGLTFVAVFVLIAVFANFIAPMDPDLQTLEYSLKPSGFRGNLLAIKSPASEYQEELVAIESFVIKGDSVFCKTTSGEDKVFPKLSLNGKTESQWHHTPLYIMGTDRYGRDVFSRLIYGARISLSVGFIAEGISLFIGIILGALAGYFRGWVDGVVMWITNVVWSFPFILLVIAFSLVLGQGFWQTFVAIGIANWVDVARIVRGQFFSLRETEYVEATRALGFSSTRTIFKHILPNALGPIIVIATAGFASTIIAEASLSYLGLGVQPPMASWGQMIRDGHGYIVAGTNWGLMIYPAVTIALAVFAFNVFGDGLRDALDPKLKR